MDFASKIKFNRIILGIFIVLAILTVIYVLFIYPQPGVADQGDFDRVMGASGLDLLDEDKSNPEFMRFYDYTVNEYKIVETNFQEIKKRFKGSSQAYFITLINIICSVFGAEVFNTMYLALFYSVLYIFSLYLILKHLKIRNKAIFALISAIVLFVFLDGNYLIWFNSLYGEPVMITTLLLFSAAYLHYIDYAATGTCGNRFLTIIAVFFCALLFLGSKMQVITALPLVISLLVSAVLKSRKTLGLWQIGLLFYLIIIITMYPVRINEKYTMIREDTQYNSVFYGVLKESPNPRLDLIKLGLNPDMAVEAGKHSYLKQYEYVKYIPHAEITFNEFYNKMSNKKLVLFYLTNPDRFIHAMELTAENAFITGTVLGKYPESYSSAPVSDFNRFTFWSDFRSNILPKNLIFIIMVYTLAFFISYINYKRHDGSFEIREKIRFFWLVMLIGAVQFPMPYIGNGQADIAKQLFLFNFVFDIILVALTAWSICELFRIFGCLKPKFLPNYTRQCKRITRLLNRL